MRRLFALLLAGLLALSPAVVWADPITITSLAIAGAQAAGWITATTAFVLSVGVAIVGAASARRKARKAQAAAKAAYNASLQDRTVTVLRGDPPWQVVYGRAIVGGAITDIITTDNTAARREDGTTYTKADALKTLVIVLAAHEVEAIHEVYIDGVAVGALDGNGYPTGGEFAGSAAGGDTRRAVFTGSITLSETPLTVLSAHSGSIAGDATDLVTQTVTISGNQLLGPAGIEVTANYTVSALSGGRGRVRISKRLGTTTQAVDPVLAAIAPSRYTAAHQLKGLAYIVVTLDLEEPRFQGGPPNITAEVSGRKVFDPRTSTTAWSDNPALCVRDFLTAQWGYGAAAGEVDDAYVIAAANVCDQLISLDVGGTVTANQKRYTCNGAVSSDAPAEATLEDLAASMAGTVAYGGSWQVMAGAWTPTVMDLVDDDLHGMIEVAQADTPIDELINGVRGQYLARGAQSPSDFNPYRNATFATADGRDLWANVTLPFTDNLARARNLCRIMVESNRNGQVLRYPAKLKAWPLQVGDRVRVSSTEYGLTLKSYRVTDWQFSLEAAVVLTLQEDDAAVYDLADAAVADPTPNTDLANPWQVAAMASVAATSGTSTLVRMADGTIVARVKVSWTPRTDSYVLDGGRIELLWRRQGSDAWLNTAVPGSDAEAWIAGVNEGDRLVIEVRAVNALGARSVSSFLAHTVVGKTEPPADVAGFTWALKPGQVEAKWTPCADVDYLDTEIRIGATWATAGFYWRAAASEYQWARPVNGTYKLWIAHRDTSGNYSAAPYTTDIVVTNAIDPAGTPGTSTYTLNIFWTGASAPATPTSTTASYTFSTDTFTTGNLTASWTRAMPAASGTNGIWMSSTTVTTTTPATPVTITTWSAPVLVAQRGTDGTAGAAAIEIRLSNPAWIIPTDSAGGSGVYTGSGTTIEVWEGTTQLSYAPPGTSAGTWTISPNPPSASGITPGTITDSGAFATVGEHANITADSASVTYAISGTRTGGTSFTANRVQSLTRGKQGTTGSTGSTGAAGTNNAVVELFQRSVTDSAPSVSTAGSATYTFASGGITGQPSGWTTTVPAAGGAYLWVIRGLASSSSSTATISNASWSAPAKIAQDGANGSVGNSVAIVYAYRRSASDLSSGYNSTLGPGACTFDFTTNTITSPASLANSYSKTIPAGTDPLYVTVATASSSTSTDSIASTDWATPVRLVQDGAPGSTGAAGLNVATAMLYQRTYTNSAPAGLPTTTLTFTFATGGISGTPDNGWQTAIPSTGGEYLWVTRATASATTATDTISSGEWSAAQLMVASRAPVRGNSLQFGIRQASWDDQIANRVIHNIVTIASATSGLASTTHLVRMDGVVLTNTSPWIRTAGAYSAGTAYRQGDIVISGGVAYRAVQNTTGNAPPNATFWGTYRNSVTNRSNWANATSYGANDYVGNEPDAAGVNTLWIANFAHTSTGSWTSERNGGGFSEERYWDGSAWVRSGLTVDGSLLVRGSVFADALNVNKLSAVTADLGDITAGNLDLAGWVRVKAATSLTFTAPSGSVTQNVALASNTTSAAVWGVCGFTADAAGAGIYGYNSSSSSGSRAIQGFGWTGGYFQSAVDAGTGLRAVGKTDAANSTGSKGLHASAAGTGNAAVYAEGNLNLASGRAYSIDAYGPMRIDSQITSTLATGTAPLASSNLVVANLNADRVDGEHAADFVKSIGANRAELGNTTTGSMTAGFPGNNKPGANSQSAPVWIEYRHGGNTYWIPAWAN